MSRKTYDSPVGKILITTENNKLVSLDFYSSRFRDDKDSIYNDEDDMIDKTEKWLNSYFNGENPNPDELDISLTGSEFCQKVYRQLSLIPYGQLTTYGTIAKELAEKDGKRYSAQAVGYAVGHNPVAIVIPCHRVMGANNNLTGYGAGLKTKVALLQLEGINTENVVWPKKGNAL